MILSNRILSLSLSRSQFHVVLFFKSKVQLAKSKNLTRYINELCAGAQAAESADAETFADEPSVGRINNGNLWVWRRHLRSCGGRSGPAHSLACARAGMSHTMWRTFCAPPLPRVCMPTRHNGKFCFGAETPRVFLTNFYIFRLYTSNHTGRATAIKLCYMMRICASRKRRRSRDSDRDFISDTSQKKERPVTRMNTGYHTENYETREDIIKLKSIYICIWNILCMHD